MYLQHKKYHYLRVYKIALCDILFHLIHNKNDNSFNTPQSHKLVNVRTLKAAIWNSTLIFCEWNNQY